MEKSIPEFQDVNVSKHIKTREENLYEKNPFNFRLRD